MAWSSITSRVGWSLPFIGLVLALVNWGARPDRAWAWAAAIVTLVVMVVVRQLALAAARRSAGEVAAARGFASVPDSVAWGATIVVAALALTLAQANGLVPDQNSGTRITMAIIGASLAASGNALRRMLPPVAAMGDSAARVQAFQRLAGWTWVAAGFGFALAWLIVPIDLATPVSVAVGASAILVTIWQLLRLRRASGPSVHGLG